MERGVLVHADFTGSAYRDSWPLEESVAELHELAYSGSRPMERLHLAQRAWCADKTSVNDYRGSAGFAAGFSTGALPAGGFAGGSFNPARRHF